MLENGYIKLHRRMLNWDWYTDSVTKCLFLHLLLTVNYEPKKWRGITIGRGQRVVGREKLAEELGFSVQQIRTALNHLISTGEITSESTSKKIAASRIITVKNFDFYQGLTSESTSKSTSDQPELNQCSTSGQPLRKKDKKDKKDKKRESTRAEARDPSPQKLSFGEFGNVLLTAEEHQALVDKLGKGLCDQYIMRLGAWLRNGNRKRDHYATILSWVAQDCPAKPERGPSYDIEQIEKMLEER